MPVRLALIGAGIFAREAHQPALLPHLRSNAAVVTAVWSRSPASASALASSYASQIPALHPPPDPVHGDDALAALLARPDVDAVILAVPIPRLPEIALRALRAGKHVLSEKPLAPDLRSGTDALNAWAAIGDARPMYCVAENFRLEGAVLRVREAVKELGGVLSIEISAHNVMKKGSKYAFGWRVDGNGGQFGQMMDSGVHYIAAMRLIVGSDVARVAARTQRCSSHLPGIDTAHGLLEFHNGVAGSLVCSFAGLTFRWEMTVLCREGRVTMRRATVGGVYGYSFRKEAAGEEAGKEHFITFTGVRDEFTAFLEAVKSGKSDDRISASSAFNDLATIDAFAKSSTRARFVDIPDTPSLS